MTSSPTDAHADGAAQASSVDAYIAAQPADAAARLRELRSVIRAAVPEAAETISYGMPAYKLDGRRLFFAAARRHCALYGVDLEAFADELRHFTTSKGTVQFPLDRPVPQALVRKLVTARLAPHER